MNRATVEFRTAPAALLSGTGSERGAAAIEFGLMASALLLLALGMFDYGGSMMNAMELRDAARAGAQFGVRNPSNTSGIATVARAATRLNGDTLTVTSSDFCECPNGTAVACSGTCASGVPSEFISVTVSQPFHTVIAYPGLTNPTTLTGKATLRIK